MPPSTAPTSRQLVEAARRELEAAADHDQSLAALATRLAEIGYLTSDVAADLAAYLRLGRGRPAAAVDRSTTGGPS